MITSLKALLADESGATMVEYALMVALIAIVAIAAVTLLGGKVRDTFQASSDAIP